MALFGTDGVRGVANEELSPELALAIGKAAGSVLETGSQVLIGRDTRISSGMLEAAVASGLAALGIQVWMCGMLPTPALAYLIKAMGAQAGVMISASHNPPQYNGIKLLDGLGRKWDPEQEGLVEDRVSASSTLMASAPMIGAIHHLEEDAVYRYRHYLMQCFWGQIPRLHVVVDLAHGAAISTAVPVLEHLGARVTALYPEPLGELINQECGATHPIHLQQAVLRHQADLGMAFDGDADRLIAVDAQGQVVDGDAILYALACGLKERERLEGDLVVATVMSNLGLERALQRQGISLLRTPVGDRWVAEAMHQHGAVLGGEQSGHIILQEWGQTGDGLLTGLALLAEMHRRRAPLAELVEPLERYPQVLKNIHLKAPLTLPWQELPGLFSAVEAAQQDLGEEGRVLIRPSGTEPLLRIMIEGRQQAQIDRWIQTLVSTVESHLGSSELPIG